MFLDDTRARGQKSSSSITSGHETSMGLLIKPKAKKSRLRPQKNPAGHERLPATSGKSNAEELSIANPRA